MKKKIATKGFSDINRALIEECRKGSRKAQYEIYKLYFRAMFNTSLRILNDRTEAEDVMQESFLKAFESLDQFRAEVSFGAWLKKIVINKSLDALKKKKKFALEPLETIDKETLFDSEDESVPVTPGDIQVIRDEIFKLPEGYRIVLSLYLLEGYDHDEIAEILGITASTSRSQYSRARQKLLRILKKKMP